MICVLISDVLCSCTVSWCMKSLKLHFAGVYDRLEAPEILYGNPWTVNAEIPTTYIGTTDNLCANTDCWMQTEVTWLTLYTRIYAIAGAAEIDIVRSEEWSECQDQIKKKRSHCSLLGEIEHILRWSLWLREYGVGYFECDNRVVWVHQVFVRASWYSLAECGGWC